MAKARVAKKPAKAKKATAKKPVVKKAKVAKATKVAKPKVAKAKKAKVAKVAKPKVAKKAKVAKVAKKKPVRKAKVAAKQKEYDDFLHRFAEYNTDKERKDAERQIAQEQEKAAAEIRDRIEKEHFLQDDKTKAALTEFYKDLLK